MPPSLLLLQFLASIPPASETSTVYAEHGCTDAASTGSSAIIGLYTTTSLPSAAVARLLLEHLPRVSSARPPDWRQRGSTLQQTANCIFAASLKKDSLESC
ncbi:hypothetical protein V8C37DRAFT_378728 [Trichoderma ceciliae]